MDDPALAGWSTVFVSWMLFCRLDGLAGSPDCPG